MDSGTTLRARAISAFRFAIRYWSSGAMLEYVVLESSARVCEALSKTTNAKLPNAIILTVLRLIDSLP
jgi:hypothetical protein